MIEAVIFDWAGTTVDYGCMAPVLAFQEVFREFHIEPTLEETRQPMGMLKRDHIRTMLQMERISGLWKAAHGKLPDEGTVEQLYVLFESKLMSGLSAYTDIKPYVLETVALLRKRRIKIGSTTGYTDSMMEVVVSEAEKKGYRPDFWITPDSTSGVGRPYPYMIFRNLEALGVTSVKNAIKVGDTVSDILEGKNAGLFTVGVLEGSSEIGLTRSEYEALSYTEQESRKKRAAKKFQGAGADAVITHLGDLLVLLDQKESAHYLCSGCR